MLNIIAAPASTRDAGAVRIGGYSPSLPAACPMSIKDMNIKDGGQVRIGGYSPVSLPANTKDSGAVRIGGYSPAF